ncbi:MAG TPA: hypothetical protein VLA13_03670 [Massilibacterium sp.]|nr:hypothetical protein [Massilibacterium sp.]
MQLGIYRQFVRMKYVEGTAKEMKHTAWCRDDEHLQEILNRYNARLMLLAVKQDNGKWKIIFDARKGGIL